MTMKHKGCYLIGFIAAMPFIYIGAYIMFPGIRPEPTGNEVFVRLTGIPEPPSSIRDLKVHNLFDPLLGDGAATISFSLSESEGKALASRFTFGSGEAWTPDRVYMLSQVPIEIINPRYAQYAEGLRMGIIKTNAARTVFVWHGGF